MKSSVIYGVLHMSMGIIMKGTNTIYRGQYLEFFTEVVAGFLMLFFLFGWMDILIFMKWFSTPDVFNCDKLYPDPRTPTDKTPVICSGQYENWQMQTIINVMVITVF
jgi:vacuolar-type H+-ATPase subunit I/STV1